MVGGVGGGPELPGGALARGTRAVPGGGIRGLEEEEEEVRGIGGLAGIIVLLAMTTVSNEFKSDVNEELSGPKR